MLRNSAERGAPAHVEPLVERQDLERLICQHYQWAIETCRVDPNLVAFNGPELRGPRDQRVYSHWLIPLTLSLVLPNFTTSVVGPAFSPSQLAFAGTASLVLYGVFIFVQAVRHRDYFLPDPKTGTATDEEAHAAPPSAGVALASLALLLISLIAIVSLAKALTPAVDEGIAALGAPTAVVGIVIGAVVLMPEGLAALRAAPVN
jgi:Ca2+/H+ antiporter